MGLMGSAIFGGIGQGLGNAARSFREATQWSRERQEQDAYRKALIDKMNADRKAQEDEQNRLAEYLKVTKGPEIMGLMSDTTGVNVPSGQFSVDQDLDIPRGTGQYAGVPLEQKIKEYSRLFPEKGLKTEIDYMAAGQKQPPIVKQLIDAAQNGTLTEQGKAILAQYGYGGIFSQKPDKPPNVPSDIDLILSWKFPNYFTDPETYKQATAWMSTPEGSKWVRQQATSYAREKAPPIYNFVQTDQGIVPGDVRTGGMGKPTAGPGGDPYKKPIPSEQITSLQQAKTLEDAVTNGAACPVNSPMFAAVEV